MTRQELMDILSALCRQGKLAWTIFDNFVDASHPTTALITDAAWCMLDGGGWTTYDKILIAVMKGEADQC